MVDASHVDPRMETNAWWLLRVIFVTEKLQLINATFMYRLKQKTKSYSIISMDTRSVEKDNTNIIK